MPEAVRRLRRIFAHEICRRVAAIEARHRAMRRLEPAVKLLAHDVAVGAGCRVISEVGPTLGIGEGINTDANGNTDNHSQQDALDHAQFHLRFRSPTTNDLARKDELLEFGSMGFKFITPLLHFPGLCTSATPVVLERFELLEPFERLELFRYCQPPPSAR